MEINGYPNYLIYPSGKVWSKVSKRYLKPLLGKAGYYSLQLGRGNRVKIHRLLAIHFIENPDNKPFVDHIDQNKTNNKLNNLRWVTKSENEQNTGVRKNNKSTGIKNITYHSMSEGFQYEKMVNKVRHRKLFRTLEEAIQYKTNYEKNM